MKGFFDTHVDFTSDGVIRFTLEEGRILFANRGLAALAGLAEPPGALAGRLLTDVIVMYRGNHALLRERLREKGGIHDLEYRFGVRGGGERWVILEAQLVFDEEAKAEVVEAVLKDITERKLFEKELLRNEEKTKALLNTIPDLIFQIDRQGVFRGYKAAIDELYVPPEAFLGRSIFSVLPEPLARVTMLHMERALKGEGVQGFEYDLPLRGEERSYECRIVRVNDDEVLSLVRDVTERKTAERALEDEKERLAVTLRSISDGVIALDGGRRVVLMNGAAEALAGWGAREALGRPAGEVLLLVDEVSRERRELPRAALGEGADCKGEAEIRGVLCRRDGTERFVEVRGAPVCDRAERVVGGVLVLRDVTEKRRHEEELVRVERLESIGLLASGIAHDFNNILMVISGNLSLLQQGGLDEEETRELVGGATGALARAENLTRQLFAFSRGGAPVMKPGSLRDIVEESISLVLRGSNVTCVQDVPHDLWAVAMDGAQVGQALGNIMINAVQSMPEGGAIGVRAENTLLGEGGAAPLRPGRYVRVQVRDSGGGIPPEIADRIFDPYFSTKPKGSGLGLATAWSIVKKHGGWIGVESERGAGSVFSVYLPAAEEPSAAPDLDEREFVPGAGKVLVMDDDGDVLSIVAMMLAAAGYDCRPARSVDEAAACWEEAAAGGEPFDAAILDLTIPGGSGAVEALRRLRGLDAGARAIVSSGYATDPVMADPRAHGFAGALLKPYGAGELFDLLARVVRK